MLGLEASSPNICVGKKTKEAATQTPIYAIPQVWEDVKMKGMKNLTTAILLICRSEFNSTHGKWTLLFTKEYPRESQK